MMLNISTAPRKGKEGVIQVPLLIDPSPFRTRSIFDPFKQVAFINRNPPGALQWLQTELKSIDSREVPIAKTSFSGIDRVIGRDIEKCVLIHIAHHGSFALPILARILDNAKRIYPEPSDYFS